MQSQLGKTHFSDLVLREAGNMPSFFFVRYSSKSKFHTFISL